MKKILSAAAILAVSVFFIATGENAEAKKFKFSYNSNKGGKLKLIDSFVTWTDQANSAKPLKDFCLGNTVYFYYKVGPGQSVAGKGMPFKTRMVVEVTTRNGSKKKDLGWQQGNGVSGEYMKKTQKFGYYHSARWNIELAQSIEPPSDYKITIYHNDLNSGKTVKVVYKFTTKVCN